jgi:hypothetical protein
MVVLDKAERPSSTSSQAARYHLPSLLVYDTIEKRAWRQAYASRRSAAGARSAAQAPDLSMLPETQSDFTTLPDTITRLQSKLMSTNMTPPPNITLT